MRNRNRICVGALKGSMARDHLRLDMKQVRLLEAGDGSRLHFRQWVHCTNNRIADGYTTIRRGTLIFISLSHHDVLGRAEQGGDVFDSL